MNPIWGGADLGYERSTSGGLFTGTAYISAGVARTGMTGDAMEPFVPSEDEVWSFLSRVGITGSVRMLRDAVARIDVSAMSFLPRAGVWRRHR